MIDKLHICQKKSGNFIISQFEREEWQTIGTATTPKELLTALEQLPMWAVIIKKEYSKSQSTCYNYAYNLYDAIKAFDIPVTKENIKKYS